MAPLICSVHPDTPQHPRQPFCTLCGNPLRPAPNRPATPIIMCPVHECIEPLVGGRCVLHSPRGDQRGVTPTGPALADAAAYQVGRAHYAQPASQAVQTGAHLIFPWGRIVVPQEFEVLLGRNEAKLWGHEIGRYDNVSREHATINCSGGRMTVCDRNSINGTTINGRRIQPDVPMPVNHGDVLGFGADLRVSVEIVRPSA